MKQEGEPRTCPSKCHEKQVPELAAGPSGQPLGLGQAAGLGEQSGGVRGGQNHSCQP